MGAVTKTPGTHTSRCLPAHSGTFPAFEEDLQRAVAVGRHGQKRGPSHGLRDAAVSATATASQGSGRDGPSHRDASLPFPRAPASETRTLAGPTPHLRAQ